MQRGGWVPIDKGFVSFLPKDRPYSELEAAFSLTCDYDEDNGVTIEGYMKLWKWGKGKVYRFIEKRGLSLYRESKRAPGKIIIDKAKSGRPVIRDSRGLRRTADAKTRKRTQNGRKELGNYREFGYGADDKQVTTTYPNPGERKTEEIKNETEKANTTAEDYHESCAGISGQDGGEALEGQEDCYGGFETEFKQESTMSESANILSGQEKELDNSDEWEKKLGHWRNRRTGEVEMFDEDIDRA